VKAIDVEQEPRAPECGQEADSCDRGWEHERQFDERQQHRAPLEASRREQVGSRRAEDDDERLCDRTRAQRDDERITRHRIAELVQQRRGRDAQEDREHR